METNLNRMEDTISLELIENADIVITIDRRGVAQIFKHRTADTRNIDVEVTLTHREPVIERYSSKSKDTSADEVRAERKRVAVSAPEIRELLEKCILNKDEVLISGTKVNGVGYSEERRVRPLRLMGLTRSSEKLHCVDCESNEDRAFYLSSITRVEVCA